MATLAVLVPFS